jgi:lariat debranching enzyme
MSVPEKYKEIGDFHEYYSGKRTAPYLTVFVGGNHEASNYIFELYYGGWVAPNIYYLGAANILRCGPLRIAGLSGIWSGYDYRKPHFERLPYNRDDIKSIYHVRELDVRKLLQIRTQVDLGLSHDWPRKVEYGGDFEEFFRVKWGFEQSSRGDSLGSPAAKFVLDRLRPARWFSAHLHVKFTGSVVHSDRPVSNGQSQNRRSAFGLDENYVSSFDSLSLVENDMSETAVGVIEVTSLTTLNADNQDSITVKDCQVSDTLVIDEVSVMKPRPEVPQMNMLQDNDKFGQRAVQGDRSSRISAWQNFHAVASKQEAEATALYRKEMEEYHNKERAAEKAPDFNYQLTWRKVNVGQDSFDRKISAVEKTGFEEEPGTKRPKLEPKTVVKNTDEISLDSDTDSDTAPPITELAVCPEAIITNFLALDKCVRGHEFLCLDEITVISDPDKIQTERPYRLEYDKEWLAITRVFAEDLILGESEILLRWYL